MEIERARLIRKLVEIKKDQGKINEAAEIIQDVAVETFSAMAKTERIDFILEQVFLQNYKLMPQCFFESQGPIFQVRAVTVSVFAGEAVSRQEGLYSSWNPCKKDQSLCISRAIPRK